MTGYISIRIEFGSTEQKPDYSNLIRGLANSFYKEPDSKRFSLLQAIQSLSQLPDSAVVA